MRPVTVLPLARIGTVVSSPCSRSAARTCASISACSGASAAVQAPTWSASVETLRSMPSRRVALALPVERLVLAELLEQDHGQQVRPGKAARRDMERRRRLGDRLARPAGELLAHRLDHLPPARDHLQRLGDVLAQLRQLRRAAARAAVRRGDHDALARQMGGEGLARRAACARTTCTVCVLRRRLLRRQFVLGRRGLQLLELQLHLLEQPGLALRAAAVELAPQLLDLQLQMGDQRLGAGVLPADRTRRLRASASNPRAARSARIIAWAAARSVGSGSKRRCHTATESYSPAAAKPKPHPTAVGRQVSCGWRQSMPESR